ncbi:50S ribosomal protein L35 [candidate division TM6 bacterium JCVI TM6SC1]|jgi:large subunit ribosomal protein L35|uniref:Large ribosomal subunit protein bL35 n=1 Tax=candidate division TM6 bacterium JCVI TM6SC1 TaxID=1306947 RepID=A0A0D2K418_9BACT|nr:50S ribosomal protein L35 [candidate division TM6 bacterium JCVI TM6SC1]
MKMKTKSAAKKRFRAAGGCKIKRASAFRRHLLTKKSSKRKRQLRGSAYVSAVDHPRIVKLLPYWF